MWTWLTLYISANNWNVLSCRSCVRQFLLFRVWYPDLLIWTCRIPSSPQSFGFSAAEAVIYREMIILISNFFLAFEQYQQVSIFATQSICISMQGSIATMYYYKIIFLVTILLSNPLDFLNLKARSNKHHDVFEAIIFCSRDND